MARGTARGRAAALGQISSMFKDVGGTVSNIFKERAAEKRLSAEDEENKPINALRKRLLSTQVEGAELGLGEKKADIASDKELEDILQGVELTDATRETIKTSPMKPEELVELLKSAKEKPQETIQEYASFLDPDSETGKSVRSQLNPGQVEALDAMLGNAQEKAQEEPVVDAPVEAEPIEKPVLQPGEKAPVKPQVSTFRFDEPKEEPGNVAKARAILSKLAGKRPTEKQKAIVKRNQAIIDKFEDRKTKKEDVLEGREFTKGLAEEQRKHQENLLNTRLEHAEKLANDRLNAQKIQNAAKRKQALKDIERKEKIEGAKLSQSLRKEIKADPIIKEFQIMNGKYRSMEAVMKKFMSNPKENSRIAVDAAVITLYNKILDPGSVVRESEFARTSQGQALLSRLMSFDEKIKQGGTGLAVGELQEILRVSKVLRDAAKKDYDNVVTSYKNNISDIPGVDLDKVIGQFSVDTEAAPEKKRSGGLSTEEEKELQELEKQFGGQ